MNKYCYLIVIAVLFHSDLCAEVSQPARTTSVVQPGAASNEKEYSDAVVVLIDPKTGMIALSWTNEETQKEEKLSFKVDLDQVDVTNPLNQYLEFSNISVGDHVDIVTIKPQDGKETVVEILDYNATEPEA